MIAAGTTGAPAPAAAADILLVFVLYYCRPSACCSGFTSQTSKLCAGKAGQSGLKHHVLVHSWHTRLMLTDLELYCCWFSLLSSHTEVHEGNSSASMGEYRPWPTLQLRGNLVAHRTVVCDRGVRLNCS